jgi:hypothetical protein
VLLAYIDEIGEPGPYVAKDHAKFNTNPVFGYAGLVVPDAGARRLGEIFTHEKRTLFAREIEAAEHPGRWERKGSDIFTANAWTSHRSQVRVFRGLIGRLGTLGGRVFYYADQKEKGTRNQVRMDDQEREASAMRETMNRLCRYAEQQEDNLLVLMDQVNEKERYRRTAATYAHVFARSKDWQEMKRVVEPPMHIDSALSSNIQLADWIAAAVSRAIDYQLEPNSRFAWIPSALGERFRQQITYESKLRLWQSSAKDLNHHEIFRTDRPALITPGTMTPENLARLEKVKHATFDRRG